MSFVKKAGNTYVLLGSVMSSSGCLIMAGLVLLAVIMVAAMMLTGGTSSGCTSGQCGFDQTKLAKYEEACNGSDVPLSEVISPAAKDYALSIGVPAEDIKVWGQSDVENIIRGEIASQWSSLTDKHNSTQIQAQVAILSYAEHEGGIAKFQDSAGALVPIHDSTTFSPLSITDDKYKGCKNKQYAAAWDIRYDIYLGVKENFGYFLSNASGEGEARWKSAIAYTFLPKYPNCYWDGIAPDPYGKICRHLVSATAWSKYVTIEKTAYVCGGSSSGCGPVDLSKVKELVSADELKWLQQNIPIYQEAASEVGIPWQLLAAVHYREASWNPNASVLNGFELCSNFNNSRCSFCDNGVTLLNDAMCAAQELKQKAQQTVSKCPGIGGYTLTPTSTDDATIKWALYGFNGIGYGCDPNDSPYVMNPYPGAMMKCNEGCSRRDIPDAQLGAFIIYKALMGGVL